MNKPVAFLKVVSSHRGTGLLSLRGPKGRGADDPIHEHITTAGFAAGDDVVLIRREWFEKLTSGGLVALERRQVSPGELGTPVRFEIETAEGWIVRYEGEDAAAHVRALDGTCGLASTRGMAFPDALPLVGRVSVGGTE